MIFVVKHKILYAQLCTNSDKSIVIVQRTETNNGVKNHWINKWL